MSDARGKSDPRDYVLELSFGPVAEEKRKEGTENGGVAGFLSIHFKCCQVYSPIYRNAAGTAFAGHCPRCRRAVKIKIEPGGSTSRIFQAG